MSASTESGLSHLGGAARSRLEQSGVFRHHARASADDLGPMESHFHQREIATGMADHVFLLPAALLICLLSHRFGGILRQTCVRTAEAFIGAVLVLASQIIGSGPVVIRATASGAA